MRTIAALVLGLAVGFAAGLIATSWYYERNIMVQTMLPPAITQNGSIAPAGTPGSDAVGSGANRR